MQISILIALGVFFILSVMFLLLYLNEYNKRIKIDSDTKNLIGNLENENNILNQKLKIAVEDITPKRHGYYKDSLRLVSPEEHKTGTGGGEKYEFILYVTEVERYLNGESKIILNDIEVISGYDSSQYDYVKTSFKRRFVSIKNTVDIEWLESENAVKEMRKQKLERIKKLDDGK